MKYEQRLVSYHITRGWVQVLDPDGANSYEAIASSQQEDYLQTNEM